MYECRKRSRSYTTYGRAAPIPSSARVHGAALVEVPYIPNMDGEGDMREGQASHEKYLDNSMYSHSWHAFPHVMLRMSGLPYDWLSELSMQATVDRIRRLLETEEELRSKQKALLTRVARYRRETEDPLAKNRWRRLERDLKRFRRVDTSGPMEASCIEALHSWNGVTKKRAYLLDVCQRSWHLESQQTEARLGSIAAKDAFQEAVFLNSPSALAGVRRYVTGEGSAKKIRYQRRKVTNYLQNFCAKNETSGFVGPINYAQIAPELQRSNRVAIDGDGRNATRQVLMSHWAAQELANTWAKDPAFKPGLRLCRRGSSIDHQQQSGVLSEEERQVLELAHGDLPLERISDLLGKSREHVEQVAKALVDRGLVLAGLFLPTSSGDPLSALEDLLRVTPALPNSAADDVQWWRSWLAAFQNAPLNERERLLPEGENRFKAFTGHEPRRSGGEFQGDRMIFNEEAVGNIADWKIGGDLATQLNESFSTMVDLLASEAVNNRLREREAVRRALNELDEGASLPAERLVAEGCPPQRGPDLEAWRRLIPDPDAQSVDLTRGALEGVGLLRHDLEDFPLYCALDVMVSAKSAQELEQGIFTLVLAEAHHILPPSSRPFLTFHPHASSMLDSLVSEMHAMAAPGRLALQSRKRYNKSFDHVPLAHTLLCLDWMSTEPGAASTVALEDLRVELRGGDLALVDAADPTPLVLFPEYPDVEPDLGLLRGLAIPQIHKSPMDLGRHTPRIVIDGLVFQRERWSFTSEDLSIPPASTSPYDRYIQLWKWKTANGMPDQVFYKPEGEYKPILLDFTSELSCDVYSHSVKSNPAAVVFEEMLPSPDELWLETGSKRYCFEARLTLFRNRVPRPQA